MKVYVAGPLTVGDQINNIQTAILWGNELFDLGYYPYVPHVNGLWHIVAPLPYERWMDLCFKWLAACDAVVRIPGESPGADRECAVAHSLGIPVYDSIEALNEEHFADV